MLLSRTKATIGGSDPSDMFHVATRGAWERQCLDQPGYLPQRVGTPCERPDTFRNASQGCMRHIQKTPLKAICVPLSAMPLLLWWITMRSRRNLRWRNLRWHNLRRHNLCTFCHLLRSNDERDA